ncbi:hypothetical protein D5R81_15180 [Parashewanella spongiae]|uniref:Uncharacterized protein n=1 Tax=Parashewanella spongiae TaxID=342950 RepID=A0A3A6T7N0_9GAMM|nr:hypothetical protein [Parashewanella spongiae]MCL1078764.1 hypothetical protein [Parashewanella spongiae]RJY07782.1 hypothetical protein D5R81_15180 [Parashewanella spongiae]
MYSPSTNHSSANLLSNIGIESLPVSIPLRLLNHFTLRSTHHSPARLSQWHELEIQAHSKQKLHELIARYQLNRPAYVEDLTPACQKSRLDKRADMRPQLQYITSLIHELVQQCQSRYPQLQAEELPELIESTVHHLAIWFESEFVSNFSCPHLQTYTTQLFHELHCRINHHSSQYTSNNFCLTDSKFMFQLSNTEEIVYLALVLKLVASSKGIEVLKDYNHEKWKPAYLGIWHLSHTLSTEQVFNCEADLLYELIITHQLTDIDIKQYLHPTAEIIISAKALQWWHNLPLELITRSLAPVTPLAAPFAQEDHCLNSMVAPFLFDANAGLHNDVAVKAPRVESLVFGEEIELHFSLPSFTPDPDSIFSIYKWHESLVQLCIDQGFEVSSACINNLKYILQIGDWQLMSFVDGNVIECHTTPYTAEQCFTVVKHNETKRMRSSELLEITVLDLADTKQLQGRSGHKHIDVSSVFNGNPEFVLRFILLFNQMTFLPRVLDRLSRLEQFNYLAIKPQTQRAVSLLNKHIDEHRIPLQNDYHKLIDLVILFKKLFNMKGKYIAVNLEHLKAGTPSRDMLTSPNSTIELRMFHCPQTRLEIDSINKFIQGMITLAWIEMIQRKPITLPKHSPPEYYERTEQAQQEMALMCKQIGLNFTEFCALMRIDVTEACTVQGGYSLSEFKEYKQRSLQQ